MPEPTSDTKQAEPVGYFCDHTDEPPGARTHEGWATNDDGERVWLLQPDIISAHRHAHEDRQCPRAVPVYAIDAPTLQAEVEQLRAELQSIRATPDDPREERPRCGLPCLNHEDVHTCDRSPNHTGLHRDTQQKGEHGCEWATPGPDDLDAVLHAWKLAEHNYTNARDRWFGAADNVLATAAERDEARAEAEQIRAELAEIRTDETDIDWLADHVRDAVHYVLSQVEPRLDAELRADVSERAATFIKAGSAPFISARVVSLAVDHIRQANASRDQFRRLVQDALHLAHNGENAPGGTETWANWARTAEAALRAAEEASR